MSLIPQRSIDETDVVFLLDVDNTLLDNDRIEQDLRAHIREAFGAERQKRYWDIFEQLRSELGYADYLGALQQYRIEHPEDPQLLAVSLFLVNYPFAERLYAGALDVVHRLRKNGRVVILSDGDVVFQPLKVAAPDCGTPCRATSSFTFTRSRCSTTSRGGIRHSGISWWTTRSAFSRRSSTPGATV
jgi:hypothetical protein